MKVKIKLNNMTVSTIHKATNYEHSAESYIELVFTTKENYTAIVKFVNNSHYCGYIGVPKEHTDYGKDYDDIDAIFVHGGLTYAENYVQGFETKDELWFFGFDAAHYGDKTLYNDCGIFRDLDYMKKECIFLSKQLKEIEGLK